MSALKKFGRELLEVIDQDDVFEILEEGDWGAGGCWILAEALVQYLGPPATLVAVSYPPHIQVDHVAVRYDDVYIDYNGAQDEKTFIQNVIEERPEYWDVVEIVPFTKKLQRVARREGIPCNAWQVRKLISKLNAYFD